MKKATGHGGNVHAAARELRRPVRTLLDFSASINPLGPSPEALRALGTGRALLAHYPDPECYALRQTLAARCKLSSEQIVVGNGSTELIHLLPRALAVKRVLIIGPTFSEYAQAVELAGGQTTLLLAKRTEGYRPPLEKAAELLRSQRAGRKKIDAIFLCHPNSPTGQACEVAEVRSLVREADRVGIWTILDETFIEYCEEQSVLPVLSTYQRLIVLRSFTKFYALPGLRIGYLAASARAASLVRALQPPWSVNVLAQVAAAAALNDRRHAKRSLRCMEQERERFVKQLRALAGLHVFPSKANFLLIELPKSHQATEITMALRPQGLLVRDCSSVTGLNRRTIRIAVRTRRENERLVTALNGLLESMTYEALGWSSR